MTVPQIQIFMAGKTIITTRMEAIPRVGENMLYENCYFKVQDVFHTTSGIVYVICNQCWYFIKDYKHDLHNKDVERFKAGIQINAALERGDLRVGEKEEQR